MVHHRAGHLLAAPGAGGGVRGALLVGAWAVAYWHLRRRQREYERVTTQALQYELEHFAQHYRRWGDDLLKQVKRALRGGAPR